MNPLHHIDLPLLKKQRTSLLAIQRLLEKDYTKDIKLIEHLDGVIHLLKFIDVHCEETNCHINKRLESYFEL